MSVDFVVFDPAKAPRDGQKWRDWYTKLDEREYPEKGEFDRLGARLKSWYDAMTAKYPDFIRVETDDPNGIDYDFKPGLIFFSMPRGHCNRDEALNLAILTAKELGLGTYDIMSDDGRSGRFIVFPDGPLADIPKPPSFFSKLFGKAKD